MTYRVILTSQAQSDRDRAFRWYSANYSVEFAIRWYNGLHEKLETLSAHPERCPLARENELFPFDVRELLYGRRRSHRALFTLYKDMIAVLHIRHTAQRDLTEDDL